MNDDVRAPPSALSVGWAVSPGLTDYEHAVAVMERRVAAIAAARERELVWLLEHPPLYTAGTSARPEHLKDPGRFPVHSAGRGGQLTYHGPGQRILYVMLDVRRRFGGDVRLFVATLERWMIAALARLNIEGQTVEGRTGVWVRDAQGSGDGEPSLSKIAALGLRVRRGVSFHGLSLNVTPDLSHYDGIVPCGIADAGVTSLERLSATCSMKDVDNALKSAFGTMVAPIEPSAPPS